MSERTKTEVKNTANAKRTVSQKLALTAGAVAAMGTGVSEADIVFVDDRPVSAGATDGQGSVTNWDIDGNGSTEFVMWNRTSSFFYSNYFSSQSYFYSGNFYGILNFASRSVYGANLNGRGLVRAASAGAYDVFGLAASTNVGPTLGANYAWGNSNASYRSMLRFDSSYTRSANGSNFFSQTNIGVNFDNFFEGNNLFGFRFELNGNLHYGWGEIEIFGRQATITRWAYESTPDTDIHVGSTNSIPEPSGLGLLALGAAGIGLMRQRKRSNS